MFHRLGVSVLLIAILGGVSGCGATRSLLAVSLAGEIDRRVSVLEAQNNQLQQKVNELVHASKAQEKKVSILEDMASTIRAQIAQSKAEAESIKDSIGELDDEIEQLSKTPLGPDETAQYRKEKLTDVTKQRDEQRTRLATTLKVLKKFQKTVEDTQERLASE
jgi:peptidoglycan hydrolase CwlO-like protein